jgi:hypothetical protein
MGRPSVAAVFHIAKDIPASSPDLSLKRVGLRSVDIKSKPNPMIHTPLFRFSTQSAQCGS